jgi:hypothetical protein
MGSPEILGSILLKIHKSDNLNQCFNVVLFINIGNQFLKSHFDSIIRRYY